MERKTIILPRTSIGKTVRYMRKYALQSADLPVIKKLAGRLSGADPAKNVFDYVYRNIVYQPNSVDGIYDNQDLRSAQESLRTGKGNCVDYSIIISALLSNMSIPHSFRVVDLGETDKDGNPLGFQHVYVITDSGIALDPVLGQKQDGTDHFNNRPVNGSYNKEISYIAKKDFKMPRLKIMQGTRMGSTMRSSRMVSQRGRLGILCLKNCACKKRCKALYSGNRSAIRACKALCDSKKAKKTGWNPTFNTPELARYKPEISGNGGGQGSGGQGSGSDSGWGSGLANVGLGLFQGQQQPAPAPAPAQTASLIQGVPNWAVGVGGVLLVGGTLYAINQSGKKTKKRR